MAEYSPSKIIKDGNTYNFRDTTKIPLAGSNQISGSLIPATTNAYDLGGPSYQWNNAYIKSLTINGVACGDILTHNESEFVPRSGGAVINGTELSRVDTTGCLKIRGGTSDENGSSIELYGKDFSNSYFIGRCRITAYDGTTGCILNLRHNGEMYWGGTSFFSAQDNNCECGRPYNRWSVVYAASGTINTSDSRLKNSIKDIDDKLLDAWGNIEPKQYKFNDATEKKGEKARFHTGYLAQDIQAECEKQGVNASDYGLFCYDEWGEQEEESEEIETEKDGKKVKEKRVIQPKREKGNSYALRYEEALVVECKYLRRCIAKLTARIEELEKGNNTK